MVFIAVCLGEFIWLVEIFALLDDFNAHQIAGGGDFGGENLFDGFVCSLGVVTTYLNSLLLLFWRRILHFCHPQLYIMGIFKLAYKFISKIHFCQNKY